MSGDEFERADRGVMRHVWHLVATLYAGALIYAQVWQRLDVSWVLWIVVALIAEPGAFGRLAMAYGGDLLKWIRRP